MFARQVMDVVEDARLSTARPGRTDPAALLASEIDAARYALRFNEVCVLWGDITIFHSSTQSTVKPFAHEPLHLFSGRARR